MAGVCIVKKTEGGPKLYHKENNLVLASFAASSLYGMFLHADELEIPQLMSNLVFLDNSKISDFVILDKCSPVV